MKINVEENNADAVPVGKVPYKLKIEDSNNDFAMFLSMFADFGSVQPAPQNHKTTVQAMPVQPVQDVKNAASTTEVNITNKNNPDGVQDLSISEKKDNMKDPKNIHEVHIGLNDLSQADIQFFYELVQRGDLHLKAYNAGNVSFVSEHAGVLYNRSLQLTDRVKDVVSKLHKDSIPVRINFDPHLSVLLKLDPKGKLIAEFLPNNAAMEQSIMVQIQMLRERLDSKGIEYKSITYKGKEDNQNKKNRERK